MQYWIHIDGLQRGPMQLDELISAGVTPDTYVWREGLEDWVKAGELEELAGFFVFPDVDRENVGWQPPIPLNDVQKDASVDDNNGEQQSPGQDGKIGADASVREAAGNGQMSAFPSSATVFRPYQAPSGYPMPPCPSTNLVWAVIVAVLCCQVFGIVAIVYAAQVKTKYNMGNYESALKYSERAALWCQLGIAFGLVWIVFYAMLAPMLQLFSIW